jgi:hypothetical protein
MPGNLDPHIAGSAAEIAEFVSGVDV